MKKALITGVTGQDGSYLAEFLLEKGYDVHGVIRRSSVDYRERIAHLEGHPNFHLHYGDLSDSMSILSVVSTVRPDEIYNLAAQSHVQVSFDVPEFTADVDATGVLRVLEAVRLCGLKDTCRIYQASTSELYGKVEEVPQNENTPFHPYSPYAVAKQYGFWIVKEYREAYNMFCCSGILFNHESERRGETFVTRKITLAAARIAQGKQDKLCLGNLSSLRDWGYAKDYVECMWLILQNKTPEDFVIATGEQHSVREFCQLAFHDVGIELEFTGEGMNEKGIDKATGKVVIEVSPDFYRPTDVVNLWGDPSKAKRELGPHQDDVRGTRQDHGRPRHEEGRRRTRRGAYPDEPCRVPGKGRYQIIYREKVFYYDGKECKNLRCRPPRHGGFGHRARIAAPGIHQYHHPHPQGT